MRITIFRKNLVLITIIILILAIFIPALNAEISLNKSLTNINSSESIINSFQYNGSLLGYVLGPQNNPIENALVRVYFHETYEENYSDENGFYHVTNIPICYCMKNCTCSKEGYKTEWILMGIVENTTYDFILTPIDPPVYPVIEGIIGDEGWYVSPVTISFVYDPDVVATIIVNGQVYTEPIVIDYEGIFYLIWYWIDYYGNESPMQTIKIPIDFSLPILEIEWEVHGCFLTGWEIWFIVTCYDDISGVDRVEFYFDDILEYTTYRPGPYIWKMKWPGEQEYIIKVMVFDRAGNSDFDTVKSSDITTNSNIQSYNNFYNFFFTKLNKRYITDIEKNINTFFNVNN